MAAATLHHVSHFAQRVANGKFQPEPPPPPAPRPSVFSSRSYRLTPLNKFNFGHLNANQSRQLQKALTIANRFIATFQEMPGLSVVLTGNVGTGKTTIAENILHQCFTETIEVVDSDGNLLNDYTAFKVLNGKFCTATDLVQLVREGTNLVNYFRTAECIIVDDVGLEDIPYTSEKSEYTSFKRVRANAYSSFLDYIYRSLEVRHERKHLLITSNIPLIVTVENTKRFNPEFLDIFGEKGWSRLHQMAAKFMVDLTGLPDYRPLLLEEV